MIECRDLSVRAGSFELHNVSLTVPNGAHALLSGPTASGKTTLLETIAGALVPSRGSIFINSADVTRLPPESRRVALVHQRGYLFPHLSVLGNVGYGARETTVVHDLLARFGIADLADREVHRLSGGERQLVALCRALATDRDVLLLDEPFSALDGARKSAAAEQLETLRRLRTLTILHVAHDDAETAAGDVMHLAMDSRGTVEQIAG